MGLPVDAQQEVPPLPRKETVVMGRQGHFSVILRLIGVELYKLRRRAMSRVLGSIMILIVILVFALIGYYSLTIRSTPTTDYKQTPAGTALSDTQAQQVQQDTLKNVSEALRLPNSLTMTAQVIDYAGPILVIILAGTIVGGEYSVGTIRLMFTRGPTRSQFFLAKLGTLLACVVLSVVIVLLLGVLLGAILNNVTGIEANFSFLTMSWFGHMLLYVLTIMLNLFMYATLAVCLSTLGKTTAAGVAGTLIWWVLENILSGLLSLFASFNNGPAGAFMRAIPDYFISNNLDALQQNQQQYLLGSGNVAPHLTNLHALLVLACYFIVFAGLAWWTMEQRDVTN